MLSQRLRELERAELVRRHRFAPSSTSAYELTERGRGLEPVLVAMSRRGAGLPLPEGTDPALGVDAPVFTLRAGEITITGERATAEHLLRCFPPPR